MSGTKKKPITVASRKAKARRLQNSVAEKLSELTGLPWGKDELIAPREMGQSGVDVRLVGIALKLIALSIECKAQESWSVHDWIKQARENKLPNTDWLLIAKSSRNKPIVFMDSEAFWRMFSIIIGNRIEKQGLRPLLDLCKKEVKRTRLVNRCDNEEVKNEYES